ncbi:hypothetical protein HJC23_010310 [Cyclotella cryptica]|uniref:Tudor domain-containing protein n=1 Tax=Cyclotella cryptica TaxID=29204 RepID=A0ABD3QQT3_9STRA|eukprot:CCRYP_003721-RA/>CCRYP_003721-RA protein AED:0.14 eAED:0.14 QI:0/-1/0/1/-1/1/1/0/497
MTTSQKFTASNSGATINPPQHCRPNGKKTVSGQQQILKHKQRGTVNQTELSSAVAFLVGDTALNQACSLLMAQSRELFGSGNAQETMRCHSDDGKSSVQSDACASASAKSCGSSYADSPEKLTLDQRKKQPNQPLNNNETREEGVNEHASHDYARKLASLYQKCKRAHDIIVHADEMGLLDRIPGMASVPSSPYPTATTSTPRSVHGSNTPGVVLNSMPPPPPSLAASSGVAVPSLLRQRNVTAGNPPASSLSVRPMFRKKPSSDGNAGQAHHGKLQRSNSDASSATSSSAERRKSADPPLAVLDFLKKLNGGIIADNDAVIQSSSAAAVAAPRTAEPQAMHLGKKRKTTSPSPAPANRPRDSAKRPPPPPSSSMTTNDRGLSVDDTSLAATNGATALDDKVSFTEDKPSPSRRSTRSASKRSMSAGATSREEKIYGVGESVMVKSDGTWFAAIVKDVDYGSDDDQIGDGSISYEVEFDNGEISSGVRQNEIRVDES